MSWAANAFQTTVDALSEAVVNKAQSIRASSEEVSRQASDALRSATRLINGPPAQPCTSCCQRICSELHKVRQYQTDADLANAVYDTRIDRINGRDGRVYTRVSNSSELAKLGLDIPDINPGEDSDFRAAVFKSGPDYVISFKGTQSPEDWVNNGSQALIANSKYYTRAQNIALASTSRIGSSDVSSVRFVGHSLGGGLASAAARRTGSNATTFNSAGLHPLTIPVSRTASALDRAYDSGMDNLFAPRPTSRSNIDAVFVYGEALTSLQAISPLPNAAQTSTYGLWPPSVQLPTTLHGMKSVIDSLSSRREKLAKDASENLCDC